VKVSKRLALGAAAVAAAGVAVPSFASSGDRTTGSSSVACNDGTVYYSPTTIWPPNHKMVPVHISYADTDNDGDTTTIAVTGVTETDGTTTSDATVPDTLNGSGAPGSVQGPDAAADANYPPTAGSDPNTPATWTEDVRAERSGTDGHGSGRTYTITVQCTDTNGTDPSQTNEFGPNTETGTATFTVTVPHDQGVVKQ
jgi:hypothetical protein